MPGYNIMIHTAKAQAPCGLDLEIPFTLYSAIKSAGGETLVIDSCPQCKQEHRLPLDALRDVVVTMKPVSGLAMVPGNGRQARFDADTATTR